MAINKDLKLLTHPFIFILKEGKNIKGNYLDYHLLILQVNCPETIRSPVGHIPEPGLLNEIDMFNPTMKHQHPSKMETGAFDF